MSKASKSVSLPFSLGNGNESPGEVMLHTLYCAYHQHWNRHGEMTHRHCWRTEQYCCHLDKGLSLLCFLEPHPLAFSQRNKTMMKTWTPVFLEALLTVDKREEATQLSLGVWTGPVLKWQVLLRRKKEETPGPCSLANCRRVNMEEYIWIFSWLDRQHWANQSPRI